MSRMLSRRQSLHPNLVNSQRNLEAMLNSHREQDANDEDRNRAPDEASRNRKTSELDEHNHGNQSNHQSTKGNGEKTDETGDGKIDQSQHADRNNDTLESDGQPKRRVRKPSDGDSQRLAKVMKRTCKANGTVVMGEEEVEIYQVPTQSSDKDGFTEYSIVSPRTVHGTHTKVLVLFETPHGANSNQVINMLVNFVFGVTFDDYFRLELSVSQNDKERKNYMVFIPCQDGGGVRFNVLAIVAGQLEPTTKLVGLLQIMHLVSDKIVDHIDSYIATFNDDIRCLDDSDVSVLSSFQSTSSPEQRFMIIVPREKAFDFGELFRSQGLRSVETCGLQYDAQTEEAYLQNTSVWRSLLAKLNKSDQKANKTGLSPTEQCVHLEDSAMFAMQSLRTAFEDLMELRRDMDVLDKHKHDVLKAKSFAGSYDVPQVVSLPVQCTNTYCLRCQVVCHENCCMNSDTKVYLCAAMATPKDEPESAFCHYGKCSGVPLGCHWTDHRNMKQTKLVKQLRNTYTSSELATKYGRKEDLRGLDKQLEEQFEKKMLNFMSSVKKSRDVMKKLQESTDDKRSLSVLQENHAEIEREMKDMQRGYITRVEQLLDSNEQELQAHRDAVKENLHLPWEGKQRSGPVGSRFPDDTRRTKINGHSDYSDQSVDSDQMSKNDRNESYRNVNLESIYQTKRVQSALPVPRILVNNSSLRSRATSALRPMTVRAKTALAAGKRRTTISWVDDVESYWFDRSDGPVRKPSAREKMRMLRSVREHYSMAASQIKPKRGVQGTKSKP